MHACPCLEINASDPAARANYKALKRRIDLYALVGKASVIENRDVRHVEAVGKRENRRAEPVVIHDVSLLYILKTNTLTRGRPRMQFYRLCMWGATEAIL